MGREAGVGGLPRHFRCQILSQICFGAAFFLAVKLRRRLEANQIGRLDIGIIFGNGKLNALIGPDSSAEHDTLAGILGSALDKPAAVADRLGVNEYALGIPEVDNIK